MTLIEILVAISISVLVLSAAASVYRTLAGSLQRRQSSMQEPAYATLEQLRQDLVQCVQMPSTNVPTFILASQTFGSNMPHLSSLAFAVGDLASSESDFSRLEVSQIGYTLIPGPAEEGQLIRETTSLWGSNALAAAVSNVVMDHVTAFEVSVLTSTGWTNNWTSSPRTLLPQVARVRLDWRAGKAADTAQMEVFIPAGNLVPGGKPVP